jgi:uncharacterized iron-regulated protein
MSSHSRFLGRRSRNLWACLCILGMGLWIVYAPLNHASADAKETSISALTRDQLGLLQKIQTANIIYLGETHDSPADHQAQLAIVQALHRKNPSMAIALEMFQRPYQVYLSGALSEEDLLTQTEYRKRWGFDWNFYAPIVRFARAKDMPLVAINAPTEITRKVARFGLDALEGEDFKWIPPRTEIDTSSASYRKRLLETYESFHQGKGNSDGFERFFQAQVLWDETMAEAIAQFWLKNPNRKIVVLVGQGHLLFGDGIPSRVARRIKAASLQEWKQYSVLLNPPEEIKNLPTRPADFFWFSPL